MSKERQRTRAQREAGAAQRAAEARARRDAVSARRARDERRRLLWARLRVWQHGGPGAARRRERWGVMGTVVLLVLLVVYVWTRSVAATAGTALICVIAAPVLALLVTHDRSRP